MEAKHVHVLITAVLLTAILAYYIRRKPVYDRFQEVSSMSGNTITINLSNLSGSYITGTTGSTQPITISDLSIPTLQDVSGTFFQVAAITGGPFAGGIAGAGRVEVANGNIYVLDGLIQWFSTPYKGPGTYTGTVYGGSLSLVIGDNFPCPSGSLSVDLTDISSPSASLTFCGNSANYSLTTPVNLSDFSSIGPFVVSSGNELLQGFSLRYNSGTLSLVDNNNVTWMSTPYTGPGSYNAVYSGPVIRVNITVILGNDFPDSTCVGQSDGYVCGSTIYGEPGKLTYINVRKACISGKCVDCTQNTSSICKSALQASCEADKNACDNQPCTGQDPDDCADDRATCAQAGQLLYGHFGVSC